MIWNSIFIMAAIDLLIIGMTTYALVTFFQYRKSLKRLNLYVGASFVLLGLTIIALFYLADLLTMFLLPLFMPMKVAMDIMRNLHLNYNWIVALCGVGLIISGFIYMTRILFPGVEKLLSDIEGSKEALVEDLIERKKTEETLKKTEARLNRAQEVGNVGTWDWNINTGELIWSDEIYRILGYSLNEIVPSYELFLERVHPGDREFLSKSVEEALQEKKKYDLDCRVISKNGLERIANAQGEVIFDESGKPMQMLGTFQDITERKRIEEELRFYSEISMNMSDGINLVRAADGVLLHTNQKLNEMFGYDDGELLGKHVSVLNANEDELSSEEFVKNVRESLNKKGEWNGEVRNKKKDNTLFWTHASIVKFRHFKLGDCYLSIQYDITNSKEAEHNLKKAKQDADAASKAKSEFLANMSHEIRTPMTGIIGMAELLSETKLDKEQMELVGSLTKSGDSLLRIINDILDLSKVEAGLIALEDINFSLAEEIEKVFSIFEIKAVKKGIKLKKVIAPHVPDYLVSDPARLRQVLINLVGNALKFTDSGEITVSSECEDPSCCVETCNFIISVSDTGIGIPAHKLETIFEEFYQADSSTTRIYGGTGLGLAISKKLLELMGGRLWVKSKEGEGCTFYFTLGMKIGSREEGLDEEPTVSLTEDKGKPLRILLAEDAEDIRLLVKAFLKDTPHTLDMVETGEEAVEMFTANEYDLVLMDMQMPVMDGYTATRIIRGWEDRNERKAIPVIAFTAHALKEEVDKCIKAGCTDHLAKPIKKKNLLEAISSYSLSRS